MLSEEQLYAELWISLASLLRSYTAAYGLGNKQQAIVEQNLTKIAVKYKSNWMNFEREGANVRWQRADGTTGTLEMTESGRLRGISYEEEMDMAAETWARELMQ